MKVRSAVTALLLVLSSLSGCGEDEEPVQAPVASKADLTEFIKVLEQPGEVEQHSAAWKKVEEQGQPGNLDELLGVLEHSAALDNPDLLALAIEALVRFAEKHHKATDASHLVIEHRPNASTTAKRRMIALLKALDTSASRVAIYAFLNDFEIEIRCVAVQAIDFTESDAVLSTLKENLTTADMSLRKDSALALGRIKYVGAIEDLIELLDSSDKGLKANAAWALQTITRQPFPDKAAAKRWYQEEKAREENNVALLAEQVRSGNPKFAPLAALELTKMTIERQKAIDALTAGLDTEDVRLRAAICEALGKTVRSGQVLKALVERLNDPSGVVTTTAWRALKALTGKELPKEPEAWGKFVARIAGN